MKYSIFATIFTYEIDNMIKHVVLFKLKDFESAEAKADKLNEIKMALEGLLGKISELKTIIVGINCNENESFDFALETTFESMEAMDVYAKHPLHVAIVTDIIKPFAESRACVDYQL
ncbi:Dabb family protein [Saccharicrinis aurantiacus]|uniref:Dabb family protein n=1 Tax=Saccharicrinis aurantiacus TaxID=1849719 RepID=UPI002491DEA2|nr:Dabb family protein [Saccharicrinis aurantiacus]